jgi:hypothetical protein
MVVMLSNLCGQSRAETCVALAAGFAFYRVRPARIIFRVRLIS